MIQDILGKIRRDVSREGSNRLQYTRKAFQMIPQLTRPRILDVGCGPGGPTLELARLSDGEIIGLDIHQPSLDELSRRIEEVGLSERVHVVNCSLLDMDFPDESFDLIWSEGSIHVIGFERGLKEWRRFIRSNGFLVVHDMIWLRPDPPQEILSYWRKVYPGIRTASEHMETIPTYGYELIRIIMLEIVIPSRNALRLEYLVLDMNGTIALDGQLIPGIGERLDTLGERLDIWLVSANTQGTLASLAASPKVQARRLQPGDEAAQKAAMVAELGADQVVAIGNGTNDAAMLRRAALGIAVLGGEGLAAASLSAADVIAPDIGTALDLLLRPRRLIATLRT